MCEVHYTTPAGLQESFRKFFKFQVLKPLDVKTKFYNAETDEVYLEAQVMTLYGAPESIFIKWIGAPLIVFMYILDRSLLVMQQPPAHRSSKRLGAFFLF